MRRVSFIMLKVRPELRLLRDFCLLNLSQNPTWWCGSSSCLGSAEARMVHTPQPLAGQDLI